MSAIDDLLKLLDRIPLWKKLNALPDRVDELEKRIAILESASKEPSEFLDLGMCLLKRNPTGGYFNTPLCPSCKKPLSDFFPGKLNCGSCSVVLDSMAVMAAVKKALAS